MLRLNCSYGYLNTQQCCVIRTLSSFSLYRLKNDTVMDWRHTMFNKVFALFCTKTSVQLSLILTHLQTNTLIFLEVRRLNG